MMMSEANGFEGISPEEKPECCKLIKDAFLQMNKIKTDILSINLQLKHFNDTEQECRTCRSQRNSNLQQVISDTVEAQNSCVRLIDAHQKPTNGRTVRSIEEVTHPAKSGENGNLTIGCEVVNDAVNVALSSRKALKILQAELEFHIDKGEGCFYVQKPCKIQGTFSFASENYECLRSLQGLVEKHLKLAHKSVLSTDSGFLEGGYPQLPDVSSTNTMSLHLGVQESGDDDTIPKSTEADC